MKKLTKNNVRKVLAVALTVIVGVVTMIPDSAIRTNADESDAAAAVEATEDVTSLTEYTISEDALAAADETAGDLTEEETTETAPDTPGATEEASTEISGNAEESTEETSEEASTEDVTTEEGTTEEKAEEPAVEENTLVVFDHIYNEGISLSQDFSSCELLVKTSDPSVFTKNTNVVSEYEGVYLLRFANAEETKSAYSYYYGKVGSIEVNKVCFSISTGEETPQETPQETEAPAQEETPSTEVAAPKEAVPDVADLSGLNQGNDALSLAQNLPDTNMSGAIALIDTGCSGADKSVSVLGGGSGDDNGHGTKMLNAIKEEYPSARVLSIKALNASGSAQISDIYAAIKYAIDARVSVINLSLVAPRSSETALVEQAINEAISNGIVVVGAAGNQGMDASSLVPSGMSGVVVAGACDDKGVRQSFSNYGSTVDYNVVASSTSEASAILSAMIARDGVSGLKVNEGKLFATDYVASETDATEATTEAATEDVTETTTEAATTEDVIGVIPDDSTASDATGTDADKKHWNIKDLIEGVFRVQGIIGYDTANTFMRDIFSSAYGFSHGTGAGSNADCADYVARVLYGHYTDKLGGTFPKLGHFLTGSCTQVSIVENAMKASGWNCVFEGPTVFSDLGGGYNEGTVANYNSVYNSHAKTGDVIVFVYVDSRGKAHTHVGICGGSSSLIYQSPKNGWNSYDLGWYVADARFVDSDGNVHSSPLVWSDTEGYRKVLTGMYVYRHDDGGVVRICKNVPEVNNKANVKLDDGVGGYINVPYAAVYGANYGIYRKSDNKLMGYCWVDTDDGDPDNVSGWIRSAKNGGGSEVKLPIGDYYAKEVDVPSVMQTGSGISAVTANIKYYRKNTTTYDFSITKDGEKVTLGKPRKSNGQAFTLPSDNRLVYNTGDGLLDNVCTIRVIKSLQKNNGLQTWTPGGSNDIVGASYGVFRTEQEAKSWKEGASNNPVPVGYCYVNKDSSGQEDNVTNDVRENIDGSGAYIALIPNKTYYVREVKKPDSGYWGLDPVSYPVKTVAGKRVTLGVNPVYYTGKALSLPENETESYVKTEVGPEQEEAFSLHLIKRTAPANVSCVENNPNYSLNGAEYTVYTERECINVAKDKNGNPAVLRVTAAPGAITASSNTLAMNPVAGTYFIKETKAPDKGYQVDDTPQRVVISAADFGTTKEVTFNESTNLDPVNIVINKVDAKTGKPVADGAGDLSGAEFTMKFYAVDISRSYTAAELAALTPARSWVFKTIKGDDGNYSLSYGDKYKVSGDELYKNPSGVPQLPFGYITIQETKAPDGYLIEGATYGLYDASGQKVSDDDNGVIVARADADGLVKVGNIPNATIQQMERPARFDITIEKKDESDHPIANAKFKVENLTTGETHYFFTDENGIYDSTKTSNNPENQMDSSDKYVESRIWFGLNEDGSVSVQDSNFGALNTGKYQVTEVRTKALEGKQLMAPVTFEITQDMIEESEANGNRLVVPIREKSSEAAVTDMNTPKIKTVASCSSTGDKILKTSENETIKDEVTYTNLAVSTSYVLRGKLMVLHTDGSYETFADKNGNNYEIETPFTTRDAQDGDISVFCVSDTQEVLFTGVDTTRLKKGDKLVVFEELCLASNKTHYDLAGHENENLFPVIENDINNKDQTLSFITVETKAEDGNTQKQIVNNRKMVTVRDAVYMTGLVPGKEYVLHATLHKWGPKDKKTFVDTASGTDANNAETNVDLRTEDELKKMGYVDLGAIKDSEGNEVYGETTFIAAASDETQYVEFTYDATDLEGETVVVFEDLYHNKILVASHSEITNKGQTLYSPLLVTSLRDDKTLTREVLADGTANLTDYVACKNFITGETYTIYGVLYDKTTKDFVRDENGELVTGSEVLVIPEDATGTDAEEMGKTVRRADRTVEVKYSFNAKGLEGHTLVCFERAILGDKPGDFTTFGKEDTNKKIIAKHESVSDVAQTVYFAKISTTATADIEHLANADDDVKITDTVKYENLRPNSEYMLTGTVHLRYVNEDGSFTDLGTLKDKDGKTIEKTISVTTGEANNEEGGVDGSADVEFVVDGSLLAGKTVVCFETLTRNKLIVAMHEDISDSGQEIRFPKVSTSLTDKQTENRITYNGGSEVTLTDTVHYDNLIPGKEYELRATLHVKNGDYVAATSTDALPEGVEVVKGGDMTDATVLYVNGKPVTGSTTFTPEESSGDADVTFTFDAAGLGGYTLVCAEKLYYKGVLIGIHADLSSKEQTSNVPRIHTLAVNNLTGTHVVKADGIADITDFIYFENFKEGETYRAYGTLMNQLTGEPVKDKEGNNVTGYTEFSVHGTDDLFKNVTVTDSGKTNLGYYDQAGTDNEEIYNAENADAVVAAVADGREEVTARRVVTEDMVIAYFTDGTSTAVARHQYITISKPTVSLGVNEGANASVKVDINTEETTTNETGGIDGIVKVHFAFDASNARGLKTVVFEEVYNVKDGKETLVADHKNISDEDQSLTFTDLHTTFTENTTGSHDIPKGLAEVTLTDRVAYTNLQVGHVYTVTGTVHVKGDKSGKYKDGDVLKYEDGTPVTKSVTFTAQTENGSVDVSFTIPASIIPKAQRLVAFEKVEEDGAEVAIHMDLDDENQGVTPPDTPGGPPKTGVTILNILIAVIVGMIGGAISYFSSKKRKEKKKDKNKRK